MSRRPYLSDLSNAEWEVLEPLISDAAMTILSFDVSDIIGQAEVGQSTPLRKRRIVIKTSGKKQRESPVAEQSALDNQTMIVVKDVWYVDSRTTVDTTGSG